MAAILLAPTLLVMAIVTGIPIVMSVTESFFRKDDGVDPVTGAVKSSTDFVGIQNFTDIFAHPSNVAGVYGSMDRLINASQHRIFTVICVVLETVSASSWR